MKRTLATALSAALLLAAPGTQGWAQAVRTAAAPVRTAPSVGGLGVSGAAPVLAPLAAPTLSAPSLSLPTALPALGALPTVSPSAAAAAAVAPAGASAAAAAAPNDAVPHAVLLPTAGEGAEAAAPKAQPKAAKGFSAMLAALSLPGLVAPKAGADAQSAQASADFSARLGGGHSLRGAAVADPQAPAPSRVFTGLARSAADAVPVREAEAAPAAPSPEAVPAGARHRSVYFPLALAAVSAAWFAAMGLAPYAVGLVQSLLPAGLSVLSSLPGPESALGAAAAVLFTAAGASLVLSAAYAAWESVLFTFAVARRAPVSDEEFWRFARKEVRRWGLHPSVAASLLGTGPGRGILRVWRPASPFQNLSFGFTANGAIWLRPELARTPWLFRWVLKHELAHYARDKGRGPPQGAGLLRRAWDFSLSETVARLREWGPKKNLAKLRIPVLERVLAAAQLSLALDHEYDALIIHPGTHEVRNPATFEELSGGRVKVSALETGKAGAAEALSVVEKGAARHGDKAPTAEGLLQALSVKGLSERYRLVVYPQSFGSLPTDASQDHMRLSAALRQLDELSLMRHKLAVSGPAAFDEGTPDGRRFNELSGSMLGRRAKPGRKVTRIKTMLDDMMFRTARQGLSGLPAASVLERLYQSLDYKGALLLPFAPGEQGLDTVQRLVRYWQAADGGSFQVSRVDLPEGGHVIVARKIEPRVDLWLAPRGEGKIFASLTRAFNKTPAGQEEILRIAGFSDEEVARFRQAGLIVKHVFGPEHGNRVYISVKRSHAKALKRYGAEAGIKLEPSYGGYQLLLRTSGALQGVDKAWTLGFDGAGGKIYDIDTGLDTTHPDYADRDLKSVDFVNEGPEDWLGHGTHKAGISYANGPLYKGMAPKAEGRMGKVFAQSGFGASDGDIMAAAVDAMKWNADVISLSLGSPGTVDAKLAQFFSDLTKQKNKNGHYPIITASAGNAGPFNETRSQPSTGEFVTTVTAAAKSEDDGVPEMSFYSSVGPVSDKRWSRARWRRPYGLTALGGDVTTPPGVLDVYQHGIESAKSKDMPAGPSDAPDGKHTRMSGTSMSNPMVAAIALLVKQAAMKTLTEGSAAYRFFMENLPQAVTLILMRSAKDMGVPVFMQEGGFVDAEGAVRLAASTFGGSLVSWPRKAAQAVLSAARLSRRQAAPAEGPQPWDWMARAQAVWAMEDRPYMAGEAAKTAFLAGRKAALKGNPDAPSEDEVQAEALRGELGDQANVVFDKGFQAARANVLPDLVAALKDEVWLVRLYAAFALANHKSPEAAAALTDAAVNDADARVRQTAFFALGEIQSYSADEALRAALSDPRPDVRMGIAYALARHGDASYTTRIAEGASHEDKRVRLTAVWLAGRLGSRAPPALAEALAARAVNERERGNVRHVAVASLTEIASVTPDSATDETILSLLAASGPQNFALTRTIQKFFGAVSRSAEARRRMAEEPLKGAIVSYINKHKAYANHEGALGQMVRLLARIVNLPLDLPTPLPDPKGAGVPGVDATLGPVHLVVELPEGGARIARFQDFRGLSVSAAQESASAFGLDADTLARHDAQLQTAMPMSQAVWMNVAAPKVTALRSELEARGFKVRRAGPMYRLTKETGPLSGMPEARESRGLDGKDVLVAYLDEGGDDEHPALPKERIQAKRNFIPEDGGLEDVQKESVSHGTHGMGIVGGQSFDGTPYVGMAPGVRFAVGKVLGAQGGSEATVMAGLEWAASLVADPLKQPVIVNLSLGGPGEPDSALGRLVNKLRLKNILVVCAAGNEGPMEGTVGSPANAPLAVSVGAVDKKKALTDYSSRGKPGESLVSWLDFGGGVFFGLPNPYEIVSALNRRLADAMEDEPGTVKWKGEPLFLYMSGTSMAAPHSTGKLALLTERLLRAFREKGRDLPTGYSFYLETVVERSAAKVEGAPEAVGAGLFDAEAALKLLDAELADLDAVAAKAEAMMADAQKRYGDQPAAPPSPTGWLGRLRAFFPAVWGAAFGPITMLLR